MTAYDLVDDFGRHTKFDGALLVEDTTDTDTRRKPQWTDTDIYRTEGGRYIVLAKVNYRMRHLTDRCARAAGYDLVPARPDDTLPCAHCNPDGLPGGYGQEGRVRLDVCEDPTELIACMSTVNQRTNLRSHSHYSQALLARVSEQDDAVRAAWMEQVVR